MFRNLFRTAKPEVLPPETRFNERVNYRIFFYLEHDLPKVFPKAGRERAESYQEQLDTLARASRRVASLVQRPNKLSDATLVMKVFRDVVDGYGSGPLGTSMTLRTHLIDALCEHLELDAQAVHDAMDRRVNNIISQRVSLGESFLNNVRIGVAEKELLEGLYNKGYKVRPVAPAPVEPGEIEMRSVDVEVIHRGSRKAGL